METENDSPDELEIVYPTLSKDLAPSRACATGDIVPLNNYSNRGCWIWGNYNQLGARASLAIYHLIFDARLWNNC